MARFMIGTIAVCVALIGLSIWLVIESERQWKQFAAEHQCRVIAKISGDTINTMSFDSKGNPVVGIATTPDKTGWLCNDGITYYR